MVHCCKMDHLLRSDSTSGGTSLDSGSQMATSDDYYSENGTNNWRKSTTTHSDLLSEQSRTNLSLSCEQPNYMREWRKWRRNLSVESEKGQRPLQEDSCCKINRSSKRNEVVCCIHGRKCSEYFDEMSNRLPSLWPTSLLISFENTPNADVNVLSSIETFIGSGISETEILCRYYIGQKKRKYALPKPLIAQSFRLYHEVPDDDVDVNDLEPSLSLHVVFITNNLRLRHFRVIEVHSSANRPGIRIECGDPKAPLFWGLRDLVWHYSTTYAYMDESGLKSRFPSNSRSSGDV